MNTKMTFTELVEKVVALQDYGYNFKGAKTMIPLQDKDAVELFESDKPVYLLHENKTKAPAVSKDEIIKHFSHGGIVGIKTSDLK